MKYRSNDPEKKTFFRSERFYCIGGQWFFTCREGREHGPFDSKKDAEAELMMFLRHVELGEHHMHNSPPES
jgi:hypothetical protein